MNILILILFGALTGWIASAVMNTSERQGLVGDILLGVIGAVVGGLLFNFFGFAGVTGFNLYSILVAVLGGIVVISIGRLFS